jgi:hypothetical protein
MPWREHLTAEEHRLVAHPDAKPQHFQAHRIVAILENMALGKLAKVSPHAAHNAHVAIHVLAKNGGPLQPLYAELSHYIAAAIDNLGHAAGLDIEHAGDWFDRQAQEINRRIARHL